MTRNFDWTTLPYGPRNELPPRRSERVPPIFRRTTSERQRILHFDQQRMRPQSRSNTQSSEPQEPIYYQNLYAERGRAQPSSLYGGLDLQHAANGGGIAGQYPSRNSSATSNEHLSDSAGSLHSKEANPLDSEMTRRGAALPASRSLEDEEQELTELAAPAPVQEDDTGQWRREDHLEDAEKQAGGQSTPRRHSSFLTQLYILSNLIFFSLLGVLARLGVQWLTLYPGAPVVISNLWANFGGTLVMGFLAEDRKLFRQEWGQKTLRHFDFERGRFVDVGYGRGSSQERAAHSKVKKTIPLFIGVTTGFCGTFTSFSTFLRDTFYALDNGLPSPINHPNTPPSTSTHSTVSRNNGYSVNAILAIIILTITASNGALYLGAHLAIALNRVTPTFPFKFIRNFLDPLLLILGPGCWLGAIFMTIWPPDRPGGPTAHSPDWRAKVLFSLVFAPVGCLMRFYASLKLNAVVPSFPLGTFAVNVFGVAILNMSYALQHVPLLTAGSQVGAGMLGCQILQGVQDGFCGALTTVSTWIVELNSLKRRHAYIYGSTSVLVGLALTVAIMGSVRWSVGFRPALCYPGGT